MGFAKEQVEAGRSIEINIAFDNPEGRSTAVSPSSRSIFGCIVVRTAASPEEGIEAPIFASAYTVPDAPVLATPYYESPASECKPML
jgi:hypothetical protein